MIYALEHVLVLALAGLVVMDTSWFQHLLERQVIARLETLTGGHVEVARFRFKPWIFQITMQGLAIHGTEAAGEPALFSVGEVDIGISPVQFLHQRLRLRHVDLSELQVHLHTNSQGITNLPRPQPQDQISAREGLAGLVKLSIGRLTVSRSTFFWNNQMQPVELNARELAILLNLKRGRYTGTISSSATTLRSPRWSLPPITFNSRFQLSAASFDFSSFAWQAQGTSGEATFSIVPHAALQATGSFHASVALAALAPVFHSPEWKAGTLQIVGIASYLDGNFATRGRVQALKVSVVLPKRAPLALDVTTSYALEHQQLELTNLVAAIWGGTVQGTLQASFQGSPSTFRLNSRVHQVRLDNLLRTPGVPYVLANQVHPVSKAEGSLVATWTGRAERLNADFDVALEPPAGTPPGMLPVSGAARGSIELEHGFALHLAASDFRTPHSSITAQGTLAPTAARSLADPLRLDVATNDFEEWRPVFQALVAIPGGIPLELKSSAEFTGQLTGSYTAPAIAGAIKMGQFRYRQWTWDHLSAGVTVNPGFVQISGGRVEHEKSSFQLDASAELINWQLTPRSFIRVAAQSQRTPIDGLKAAMNVDLPVRGSVSGRVDLEGTAMNMAGAGTLRIDAGAFADEPFDTFSTPFQVSKSLWKLPNLRLTKNRGQLSGDLTLDLERRFASGQLEGRNFSLLDLRRLPAAISNALPNERLGGTLNFTARGHGTAEDFHLQSSWQVKDLSIARTALGECHGTLTGEGNQLRAEGENRSPAGYLHVSARASAQGDWPAEAQGEYSGLRADPWIRAFFNREFAAAITLGGSFHAALPLRYPAQIDLQSRATNAAIDFPSIQWRNTEPVNVRYVNSRLTVDRFIMRGPSTELEIAGTVGFASGVTLALSAAGSADATLLTVFDPNLQAAGRSTLHLRLTGTPARPLMNGAMDIQDVSLTYKGLPFRFSNLQGSINLQGERAVISSLRGSCGGGTVNLTGSVTLVENPRFEVRADLGQVRIRYPTSFTSALDGNLRLAGGVDQSQLQGEIVVRQMVVNENINFISKIIESSNTLMQPVAAVDSPVASKIRLNVRVTSAPPVQVQTPNFLVVGDIDLRLQGTVSNPVQVGSIHLLRGESVFRGNRYTLVRGYLNMTNPFRTQGYLDMEVETRVQSYALTVDISGPLDRLKSAYRSDPPLGSSDILSLLALGYVRQEGSFSPVGGSPTAYIGATAILSEALSSQTTSRIQHLFGVSRIKIDPNVGVPGFFGGGALVTVEQQVTHDLTLTYVTDTSYSQYRIIQFEWNISDKVSVLGIRDQNGVFGVEFRFRRRFK